MPLEFEPISLERQQEYRQALDSCPQLMTSDFAFGNIWGWAEKYGLEWAFHHGLVFIRQTIPTTLYWAPVGAWDTFQWNECNSMRSTARFTRVPEQLANIWNEAYGNGISLEENRDHWDYVYDVDELVELKGKKFHKKKNLLNQFKKGYEYTFSPMETQCVEEVLCMQDEWIRWYEENNPSAALEAENEAIRRVLLNWDRIHGLYGGAIRVDGKVVAYTVAEAITEDSMVIHFEKGNIQYKGVYQAINQMFLENCALRFKTVNREQDLGEPGLRKAKLSYNPAFFLKKYEAEIL